MMMMMMMALGMALCSKEGGEAERGVWREYTPLQVQFDEDRDIMYMFLSHEQTRR